MVLVEISSHGIYGDAFALDRETTIGRSTTCDVRLADHTASKLHARILIEPEGALLRDLGSRNGTYVNGERSTTRRLLTGDEVRIGATKFKVLQDPPAPGTRRMSQRDTRSTALATTTPIRVGTWDAGADTAAPEDPLAATEPRPSGPTGTAGGVQSIVASVARWWESAFAHVCALEEHTAHTNDPLELASALLDRTIRILGAERGALVLVEEGTLTPMMRIDGGRDDVGTEDAWPLDQAALRLSLGQRAPVSLEADAAKGRGRHLAVFPLWFAGEYFGAVLVERELRRGAFFEREIQIGRIAAALAAPAIRALLQGGGV